MWVSRRIKIPGEGCTSFPRVKPGWSFVYMPYACSWGATRVKKWKFRSHKDGDPSTFVFFHDPLVEKKNYAQISDCYVHIWYICYCYCIAGHSLGALMHLKTKTLRNVHLSSFLQLLPKGQVSGWCFEFCIPPAICNIWGHNFWAFL